MQDSALLEIEAGIGNLKNYGAAISDEAKQHVDILGDVDTDVQQATSQLHHEAKRAVTVRDHKIDFPELTLFFCSQVQQYDDNWKFVVAILVLSAILGLLIEFSPHALRNQTPVGSYTQANRYAQGMYVHHHQSQHP